MTNTEIADKIDLAADDIVRLGWWAEGRTKSGTCAALAISYHIPYDTGFSLNPIHRAFAEFLGGDSYNDITVWNDAQPNGYAVIAKMRECANHLREV